MKSKHTLLSLIAFSILTYHPSFVLAQNAQITGSFDSNFSNFTLDASSVKALRDSGVQKHQLGKIFGDIQTYQKQRGEALGLEILTNFNSDATILPRPGLGPYDITVSTGTLMELDRVYNRSNFTSKDLTFRLEKYFSGRGVHAKAVESLSFELGDDHQTINPIDGSVSSKELTNIRSNLCPEKNGKCQLGSAYFDGIELVSAIEDNMNNSESLSTCSAAMTNFRKLYRTRGSHTDVADIEDNPAIWAAAAKFETDCLEVATRPMIPRLANFSIIKQNAAIAPYCGAFRIGPQQFVSAMHCFLNKRGKIDLRKTENSSIYLLGSPKIPIKFSIAVSSTQQFKRRYPDGIRNENEIPAIRDFVVLESASFDERTESEFRNIVSAPVIGQNAFLPGYFQYHSDRRSKPNDWPAGIRLTKSIGTSYCRLYDLAETRSGAGCLIHRCQAIAGYSGSPLLQETATGKLTLVGVHVRGARNFEEHCPATFTMEKASGGAGSAPITSFANIATMISTKLLKDSGWRPGDINETN